MNRDDFDKALTEGNYKDILDGLTSPIWSTNNNKEMHKIALWLRNMPGDKDMLFWAVGETILRILRYLGFKNKCPICGKARDIGDERGICDECEEIPF